MYAVGQFALVANAVLPVHPEKIIGEDHIGKKGLVVHRDFDTAVSTAYIETDGDVKLVDQTAVRINRCVEVLDPVGVDAASVDRDVGVVIIILKVAERSLLDVPDLFVREVSRAVEAEIHDHHLRKEAVKGPVCPNVRQTITTYVEADPAVDKDVRMRRNVLCGKEKQKNEGKYSLSTIHHRAFQARVSYRTLRVTLMQPKSTSPATLSSLVLLIMILTIAVGRFPLPVSMSGFEHFATVVTLFMWMSAPVVLAFVLIRVLLSMLFRRYHTRIEGVVYRLRTARRRVHSFLTDTGADTVTEATVQGRPTDARAVVDLFALAAAALFLPSRQADWLTVVVLVRVLAPFISGRRAPASRVPQQPSESEPVSKAEPPAVHLGDYAGRLYAHAGLLAAAAVSLAAAEALLPAELIVAAGRSLPLALMLAAGAGALLAGSIPAALAAGAWLQSLTGFPVAAVVPATAILVQTYLHRRRTPSEPRAEAVSTAAGATLFLHVASFLTWSVYGLSLVLLYASLPAGILDEGRLLFVLAGLLLAAVSEIAAVLHPHQRGLLRGSLLTVLLPLAIMPGGTGIAGQPDLSVRLQVAQVGLRLTERPEASFGFDRLTELPDSDELALDEHSFYDVVQIIARFPDRYAGRQLRFQGYVSENGLHEPAVVRDVIWCCLEHAERVGFLLQDGVPAGIPPGSWVEVAAEVLPGTAAGQASVRDTFVPARASEWRVVTRPRFEFVLPF